MLAIIVARSSRATKFISVLTPRTQFWGSFLKTLSIKKILNVRQHVISKWRKSEFLTFRHTHVTAKKYLRTCTEGWVPKLWVRLNNYIYFSMQYRSHFRPYFLKLTVEQIVAGWIGRQTSVSFFAAAVPPRLILSCWSDN